MAHVFKPKSTTAELVDDHASTTNEEHGSNTQSDCADGGVTARGTRGVTDGERPLSLFSDGVSSEDEDGISEVSNKNARVVKDADGEAHDSANVSLYEAICTSNESDITTELFDAAARRLIQAEIFPILSGRGVSSPEALVEAVSRYSTRLCEYVKEVILLFDDLDILMAQKREKLAADYLENLITGTVPDIKFARRAEKYRFMMKKIEMTRGRIPAMQDKLDGIESLSTQVQAKMT